MKIESQRCTCIDCVHVFDAQVVTHAPVPVWIASVQAIRCPKCGSGKIAFGGALPEAQNTAGTVEERATRWFEHGERGLSSLTIFAALRPWRGRDVPNVPHDPDDFRRCRELLKLIPEWRPRLPEIAERYPMWRPFADAWGELESLYSNYEAARGPKRAGLCLEAMYVRMTDLLKQSMLIAAEGGR